MFHAGSGLMGINIGLSLDSNQTAYKRKVGVLRTESIRAYN